MLATCNYMSKHVSSAHDLGTGSDELAMKRERAV